MKKYEVRFDDLMMEGCILGIEINAKNPDFAFNKALEKLRKIDTCCDRYLYRDIREM